MQSQEEDGDLCVTVFEVEKTRRRTESQDWLSPHKHTERDLAKTREHVSPVTRVLRVLVRRKNRVGLSRGALIASLFLLNT